MVPEVRSARAYAWSEFRSTISRGEGLLVTFVIPIGVLVFFSQFRAAGLKKRSISYLLPGTIALALIAAAFVSLSIATAFERRYGVLKRLGATPLGRSGVVLGKIAATFAILLVQITVQVGVGAWLGWSWHGNLAEVLVVLVLGTLAFGSLGLWMAGTIRAEGTLALSNLGFLVALLFGGIAYPVADLPRVIQRVTEFLPAAPLTDGLRAGMNGKALDWSGVAVLAGWACIAMFAAVRAFVGRNSPAEVSRTSMPLRDAPCSSNRRLGYGRRAWRR